MANEARKLARAGRPGDSGKKKKAALKQPLANQSAAPPEGVGREQLRAMAWRLGLIVAAVWTIGVLVFAVSYSTTWKAVSLGIPAVITVGVLILAGWTLRQAKKATGVASILREAQGEEGRAAALEKLETSFKKSDPAAVFAKAQLELQEDPRRALETLEKIDLKKAMATVADEARGQRGMIHLMLGEVSLARQLVDGIELKRHQESKSRAMLAAVVAEAWARSGDAKKALDTLGLFDPEDEAFEALRPQLYRARAYAYAHTSNPKAMRQSLRKLLGHDARLLGAFMTKKTHPLLQKEARKLLEQSGQVPRRMVVQRRG